MGSHVYICQIHYIAQSTTTYKECVVDDFDFVARFCVDAKQICWLLIFGSAIFGFTLSHFDTESTVHFHFRNDCLINFSFVSTFIVSSTTMRKLQRNMVLNFFFLAGSHFHNRFVWQDEAIAKTRSNVYYIRPTSFVPKM